jgi:hypothetical protein
MALKSTKTISSGAVTWVRWGGGGVLEQKFDSASVLEAKEKIYSQRAIQKSLHLKNKLLREPAAIVSVTLTFENTLFLPEY